MLHHRFCTACGVESYADGTAPDGSATVGINLRCFEAIDVDKLTPAPMGRAQPKRPKRETSMSVSQADKAKKLRALHEAPGAFVIANPWDAGSARMLAGLGFQALATSSGAKAGVLGKRDGKVTPRGGAGQRPR